ncbi:MAG: phytanoyl-CoA dioxygenase family protein [Phycisphaeraceae bacterium]|nr:phytanoyl-CoA dioxygenase family protein [Phycisphaeraceae bacterium]
MKTQLAHEQIDRYQRDGVLVYPGFLDQAEVAELKAAVLEAIDTMGRNRVAPGGRKIEDDDSYYNKVFTQRLNLWRISDTVKRYMLDAELGRMLCRLAGVQAMRVWHDQALIKEPFANPTAWHLDNPYWSFNSPQSISIWIALEPATAYNGCMCFLPGTQRMARFECPPIGQSMSDLFAAYPQMAQVDSIAAPMQPGDCSFHNGLTAHGAGANMTRTRRIAMTCAYMPAGSRFNGQQNILPDDYFQSLKPGDVLENDEWNPLVGVA